MAMRALRFRSARPVMVARSGSIEGLLSTAMAVATRAAQRRSKLKARIAIHKP
ncbi:MAG: hypothetical protein LRS46_01740 [Desulfurococcales archaeon]|nr:hypothetical protein [Desulfurococcales archaeon]